mgnify:CR=1 FL=1
MLSVLVLFPALCAALLLLPVPDRIARIAFVAVTAAELALVAGMWAAYDSPASGALAFEQQLSWLPQVGASYHVGLDGLSLPLVAMTTLVFLACAVFVLAEDDRPRLQAALFLALETTCLGVFAAADLIVFFLFVAGNFVPFQILMVPVRDMTVNMGLYNTTTGLVLFHVAFQSGFCTLFMRNFIRALPFPLIEAARVEGVAEWRIFFFVVLPLMKPALAALAVLVFTFIWNDYFWAVVLTQGPSAQPVTAGITEFNSQFRAAYHLMSAGSIVAAFPPVAMFFLMQKHFIAGLTLGAVK